MKLYQTRQDINYVLLWEKEFKINGKNYKIPEFNLKVPWEHILFDAKLAETFSENDLLDKMIRAFSNLQNVVVQLFIKKINYYYKIYKSCNNRSYSSPQSTIIIYKY